MINFDFHKRTVFYKVVSNIFLLIFFLFSIACSNLMEQKSNNTRQPSQSETTVPNSCQISSALYKGLGNKTFKQKINEFDTYLKNDISKYASALDVNQPIIGQSQILFKHYEYLTQNAFALDGLNKLDSFPKENWLSAYAFHAAKKEVDYWNDQSKLFNLKNDPSLLAEIESLLPEVQNLQWPVYKNKSGKQVTSSRPYFGSDCKNCMQVVDTDFIGDKSHPQFNIWLNEAMKMNLLASPLFLWIIKQPNTSIEASKLFQKGMEIYNDPWVVLGVITWINLVDSHAGDRSRAAVVSAKMKPLMLGEDQAGFNYHFWGFTLKALWGKVSKSRYYLFAYLHEAIIQRDKLDWLIDKKALVFGTKIRQEILNPDLCAKPESSN